MLLVFSTETESSCSAISFEKEIYIFIYFCFYISVQQFSMLFNTRTFLFIAQTFLEFLIFSSLFKNIYTQQNISSRFKKENEIITIRCSIYGSYIPVYNPVERHHPFSGKTVEQERHFSLVCHIYQFIFQKKNKKMESVSSKEYKRGKPNFRSCRKSWKNSLVKVVNLCMSCFARSKN